MNLRWHDMSSYPIEDERGRYLLLRPGNDAAKFLIVQVSNFQGRIFEDHRDFNIDEMDEVTDGRFWAHIGTVPEVVVVDAMAISAAALPTPDSTGE